MWVRLCLVVGGLAGCAGVMLGALAAHALSQRLDVHGLATLETVSRYLLVHGLLMLVIAVWTRVHPDAIALKVAAVLAVTGIVLFCGGLSMSVLSGMRIFGAAAPVGGTALMGAWLAFAAFAATKLA